MRDEKEYARKCEKELIDLKQLMSKSGNQKLVCMATKVEVLTNQLREANERYNSIHKRYSSTNTTSSTTDYAVS